MRAAGPLPLVVIGHPAFLAAVDLHVGGVDVDRHRAFGQLRRPLGRQQAGHRRRGPGQPGLRAAPVLLRAAGARSRSRSRWPGPAPVSPAARPGRREPGPGRPGRPPRPAARRPSRPVLTWHRPSPLPVKPLAQAPEPVPGQRRCRAWRPISAGSGGQASMVTGLSCPAAASTSALRRRSSPGVEPAGWRRRNLPGPSPWPASPGRPALPKRPLIQSPAVARRPGVPGITGTPRRRHVRQPGGSECVLLDYIQDGSHVGDHAPYGFGVGVRGRLQRSAAGGALQCP